MPHSTKGLWSRCASLVFALALAVPGTASAGGLSFVEYEPPPPGNTNNALKDIESMATSSDGMNLYTSSRNEDSIGVFTRNTITGEITFLEVQEDNQGGVDGLMRAGGVAVSPDDGCVYGIGEQEDAIAVFSRSLVTGALTFVEQEEDGVGGVTGLEEPLAVTVSPDDEHVYVVANTGMASLATVAIFDRTPPACALTFVASTTGGPDGFGKRANALAFSADSAHLYVAGTFGTEGAVHVMSRNAGTGLLTFVEKEYDGNGGVDELEDIVAGIAVSPDGGSVYATSREAGAIVVFSRNAGTGEIAFVEFQRDGGVVDGLSGAFGIAVSPDNAYVYATGRGDAAVAVFRRDTTTGALRFLEAQKDPLIDPPDEVLQGPEAIALSPAGDSLYAGTKGATVFAVDSCGNGTTGTDEQCDDGNVTPGDGCSATCRLELCGALPTAGCRQVTQPLASQLGIKNLSPNTKDQMQWKWNKGAATTLAEFGDPLTTATYVICIYDGSGNTQPLLAAAAPAGGLCKKGKPCWKAASTSYKYNDGLLTPDGLQAVQLKEGLVNGKAKMQVKGKGINLLPPALPLTLPVTVQVHNTATAVCWDATFTSATTNDGVQFKAKGD